MEKHETRHIELLRLSDKQRSIQQCDHLGNQPNERQPLPLLEIVHAGCNGGTR